MSHNSQNKKLRIAIEGNIASGKSTIIDYLKHCCHGSDSTKSNQMVENTENKNKKLKLDTSSVVHQHQQQPLTKTFGEIKKDSYDQINKTMTQNFFTRKNVNLKIFTEPVDLWRDLNGHNLLEYMYTDPSRHSFAFHSYVQLTMLQNHIKVSEPTDLNEFNDNLEENDCENIMPNATNLNSSERFNINVMERSLYSAKYCFLENIYRAGNMKAVEYEILDKWYNWMTQEHDCNLDLIFYLRTKPETCYNRLTKRGRPEETSSITMDYLQKLHDLHETWLLNADEHPTSFLIDKGNIYRPNVIVIDADKDLDAVCKNIEMETRQHATIAL